LHHIQRLAAVLERICSQNLHIHVEETFLASKSVDYLGYTLTTHGIKPQKKKILSLLAFDKPMNKRELHCFLGFINFYCQLWHHRSETIAPLTELTGLNSKWEWTNQHSQAFKNICNIIARQVLLHYHDFTKPFDIFTDASDFQLGGIITQDD
jgi:HD-GYP domain-containing protein (c-di-GMP phosphodiesterase class II)